MPRKPNTVRYVPSWFPGAYFQRRAQYFREQLSQIDTVPFEWVKKQMVGRLIPI